MAIAPSKTCLAAGVLSALAALGTLSSCARFDAKQPDILGAFADAAQPFDLQDVLSAVSERSCSPVETHQAPERFVIASTPLSLGEEADLVAAMADGVRLAGAWHLTSNMKGFGGLSGLELLQSGDLLAVSDVGAFVWIDMSDGAPSGVGRFASMLSENGRRLRGKRAGDAEGLQMIGDIALISFERDHRVLGVDLVSCGSGARSVPIIHVPSDAAGLDRPIEDNLGMEALAHYHRTLIGGLEAVQNGGTPIAALSGAVPVFEKRLDAPAGLQLTGLDAHGADLFAVFRGYAPETGSIIDVRRFPQIGGIGERLVRLERPLLADNFEGIAVTAINEQTLRLYIISDDNFSRRQKTLLFAFDVSSSSEASRSATAP